MSDSLKGSAVFRTIHVLMATILLLPIASAVPSGLTFLDATWADYDVDEGQLVALKDDQSMLAAAHANEVYLFNPETLEKIASFEFVRDITAMEFSPDGEILAISKGKTAQNDESIRLIDLNEMVVLDQNVLADDKAVDIAWSADSQVIAAPGPEGDVDLYRRADLSRKDTLSGVHNSDITCIEYSPNGELIITGDESGRYAIWNKSGVKQGQHRDLGEPISDCKFTPDSSEYLVVGERGLVIVKSIAGAERISKTITGTTHIHFGSTQQIVHLLNSKDELRTLTTYDLDTFETLKTTTFFHKTLDLVIIDDEYGRIQQILVATGTGQVASYVGELIPFGYGLVGSDLDGDNVPDNYDEDDDGDGIRDEWDDSIGCESEESIPCSKSPDLSKIRSVDIEVSEVLTISDHITLPTEASSHIRNMSRISISDDPKLTQREANLFVDAICQNLDHEEIIDQWYDAISLSSGSLTGGRVHCDLDDGMVLVSQSDSTTQITLTIVTTFLFDSMYEMPLNLTIENQPGPTDGSIAWMAPSHPISIDMHGESGIDTSIPLWWNDGTPAVLSFEEVVVEEKTTTEKIVSWAIHPLAISLYLVLCMIGILLWVRRDNQINLDLDDDDEEIESEEIDDDVSEENEDNWEDDYVAPSSQRGPPKKRDSKRTPPVRNLPKALMTKEELDFGEPKQKQVSRKRKAKTSGDINSHGPIMKTKRRRLSLEDTTEEKPVITKRKVVSMGSDKVVDERQIKRRKVKKIEPETVTEEVSVEEPVVETKKKKRKPVRRKKNSKKSGKKIDEKKLNDELVSGFLNDDSEK